MSPELHFWSFGIPFGTQESLVLEKIIRSVVVYVFLLFWFRFAGKRELGQMTPFDLVVLLILSNSLQNALIGNDNSLTGGLVGGVVLLYVNKAMSWIAVRSPGVARYFEGKPTVLIEDGVVIEKHLRHEKMTHGELRRAIRKHDLDPDTDLPTIKRALLETDGTVTITRRSPP